MKVIAFIEARQADVIRKILQHCGLWHDPAPRPPPKRQPPSSGQRVDLPPGAPSQVDPDFLEYLRYEDAPEPEPPREF